MPQAENPAAGSAKPRPRIQMKDHEGLIPVDKSEEYYFVVDCPRMHVIPGTYMGPRLHSDIDTGFSTFERWFCPHCQQAVHRARQIPSLCMGYADGGTSSTRTSEIPPSLRARLLSEASIRPPSTLSGTSTRLEALSIRSATFGSSIVDVGDVPLTFEPYSPPPPELVSPGSDLVDSNPLIPSGKPSKFGFLARWKGSAPAPARSTRSTKSSTSQDGHGSTLPRYLMFSFSMTGRNLLLWKKDGHCLVRFELESSGGRQIDTTGMLPKFDEPHKGNIRFAAEGNDWIAIVLNHNRRLILIVLHSSGLADESSVQLIEDRVEPTCLTMSPDSNYVAVGLGTYIHLFKFKGSHRQWQTILSVPDFAFATEVRFQSMSFSADSSSLIVSTQRHDTLRSPDDDSVSTYVWQCSRQPDPPRKMGSCSMPTDGRGLLSVFYFPSFDLSFIAGAISTPYPLFLAPFTSPQPPSPPNVTDFRIRCTCFSLPPNSYIAYFMDAKNKLFQVNLQSRGVTMIADLNMERGALHVNEEAAAIGVNQDGQVKVFWRQGPGLWLMEVGDGGKTRKRNLRGVWDDVAIDT